MKLIMKEVKNAIFIPKMILMKPIIRVPEISARAANFVF